MPKDSSGNFHFNAQRAMAANKMPARSAPPKAMGAMTMKEPMEEKSTGGATELHDKGDGTFHTKTSDGEEMDHPHIGHALMHIASKHSEGTHHHAHHDGMGIMSHHTKGHGSGVEGPTEHGSSDEAADHMRGVMDGDSGEEGGSDGSGMDDGEMYGKLG